MTVTEYIKNFMPTMEGWCWREKALAMSDLIARVRPKICVEIGVFGARSLIAKAIAIAAIDNGGHVYGVDPYDQQSVQAGGQVSEEDHAWWMKLDLASILVKAHRAIIECGMERTCSLMVMDSLRASQLFQPWSIDVLHIDGNHSEEVSCGDVTTWLPLVAKGGHIWMDDIHWESTKRAQALLAEACDKVSEVPYTDATMAVALYQKR